MIPYEWHYNPATGYGELQWEDGVYLLLQGAQAAAFDAAPDKHMLAVEQYPQARQHLADMRAKRRAR